jgi:hypothetical protein
MGTGSEDRTAVPVSGVPSSAWAPGDHTLDQVARAGMVHPNTVLRFFQSLRGIVPPSSMVSSPCDFFSVKRTDRTTPPGGARGGKQPATSLSPCALSTRLDKHVFPIRDTALGKRP